MQYEATELTNILRQRYQKDAILRQMYEYRREKSTLESRLNQMSKNAAHHNDHLRVIDVWFNQVSWSSRHLPRKCILTR